ncbi:hypothetical protein [Tardiphaga robiniae]|uniref:hypothetical protein n=1 Tax=Tardiphaga robiniae TaxID=943830 RepID=UPI0009D6E71B|nr:hypothetical protein [Tardiphaga robiniae]
MKDFLASIEKLRIDATEAGLVRDLATDPTKRAMYARLHDQLMRLADEVQKASLRSAMPPMQLPPIEPEHPKTKSQA